ncbi:unnamed protein product, partial [Didymodactylos carnosus]
ILLSLLFLLRRNYNQFASKLRETPSYFLWCVTLIIKLIGWSKEEYVLRTNHLKSDTDGYLNDNDIPVRTKSRPEMLRGTPHRHLSQHAPDDIMNEMNKYIESITIPRYGGQTINNNLLLRGPSALEFTGADGIFLPNIEDNTKITHGEVAHIHSNDGSFHMILHPNDTKLLIGKQWGELFPLAGLNFMGFRLPDTYTLIYAPQNEIDVKIWKKILNACIKYNQEYKKQLH